MGYFLSVGGLTWRLSLSDPGTVLPVPAAGLLVMLVATLGTLAMNCVALLRSRWTFRTWLADAVFELISIAGLYVAVLKPLVEKISSSVPMLAAQTPELIALIAVVISLATHARKLYQLWPRGQGRLHATAHPGA